MILKDWTSCAVGDNEEKATFRGRWTLEIQPRRWWGAEVCRWEPGSCWINSSFRVLGADCPGESRAPSPHPPLCLEASSRLCFCFHLAEMGLGSHHRWASLGTLITLSQTCWRGWPIRPQGPHHVLTGLWLKPTKAGQSDFCGQCPLTSSIPKPSGCPSTHPLSAVGGGKPQNPRRISGERRGFSAKWIKNQLAPCPQMKIVSYFANCFEHLLALISYNFVSNWIAGPWGLLGLYFFQFCYKGSPVGIYDSITVSLWGSAVPTLEPTEMDVACHHRGDVLFWNPTPQEASVVQIALLLDWLSFYGRLSFFSL